MPLRHNNNTSDREPAWSSVDKTRLPRIAFADQGDPALKSTWRYPHHWVSGGSVGENGVYTSGDMYLHRGGLNAAWAAANGARGGQRASPAVRAHLNAHRQALGIGQESTAKRINQMPKNKSPEAIAGGTVVLQDLDDIRDAMAEVNEELTALKQLSEDESYQYTDDEIARIEELTALGLQLAEKYADEEAAQRKAQALASINWSQERMGQIPSGEGVMTQRRNNQRISYIRPRWEADPTRGFKSFGEFGVALVQAALPNGIMDERLGRIRQMAAATGMSQGVGAGGGFSVPPQFASMIWNDLQDMAYNLMAMTDQYTVTGESLTFPAVAETSRADGSRWGGVRAYWIAEAAQMTGSNPTLREMKLEPQQLAVLIYATDKLLNNAPALNTFLSRAARDEIMFAVNNAIVFGDGVGKPTGVMNSPALVTVSAETGQGSATIVIENINNMWARMNARARMNAVWLINQDVEPQLEGLAATAGTGGFPVYLPQGAGGPMIQEASTPRLKGRPVLPVEYCQTLGTTGDIILVNLQYYAMGMQGGIQEAMSMHLRFDYNETAFRFVFAVDGKTWLDSALTPLNSTNTLSPYVALDSR